MGNDRQGLCGSPFALAVALPGFSVPSRSADRPRVGVELDRFDYFTGMADLYSEEAGKRRRGTRGPDTGWRTGHNRAYVIPVARITDQSICSRPFVSWMSCVCGCSVSGQRPDFMLTEYPRSLQRSGVCCGPAHPCLASMDYVFR